MDRINRQSGVLATGMVKVQRVADFVLLEFKGKLIRIGPVLELRGVPS
jgi:hypothetical protein